MCGVFFSPEREFIIDKAAFALNERAYDVSQTAGNFDIKAGVSLFHENRCCGKALYGIIMDSNPYDDDVISGFNSKEKRPLELIIKND